MKNTIYLLFYLSAFALITSCTDESESFNQELENDNYQVISKYLNLPEDPYNYTPQPPKHAGPFSHNPDDKFLHPEQIKLRNYKARVGRVLFYDTRLSQNNTTSCASCHNPDVAFADNLKASKGFEGIEGRRNSLPLGNTVGFEFAYGGEVSEETAAFSWDDTVLEMQEQIKLAITSEVEMGMNMEELVRRVQEEEFYQILFEEAGPSREIDEAFILESIEAFVNGIIASETKFDTEMNKLRFPDPSTDFDGFSIEENLGKKLFNRDCSSCHSQTHTVVRVAASNNGLELNYKDNGKGEKTAMVEDMGIFKVPFLRNVALTSPYMHDGRFNSLEEVIDHYSKNIVDHPNLGSSLKTHNGPRKFNYTDEEKSAIIAYLHTLTDHKMTYEKRYQNPFR